MRLSVKIIKSQTKILFIVSILFCGIALSQANAQSSRSVPAVLEVPFAPIPVKAMDKTNLAYELHITNFSRTNLTLTGVEVLAHDARATSLASYRDAELLKRLVVISPNADCRRKMSSAADSERLCF